MFENIREDLKRSYYQPASLWRLPVRMVTNRGFRAVAFYRCARVFHLNGLGFLAKFITVVNEEWLSVAIHPTADIGPGLTLPHALNVVIGKEVKIGPRAQVFQGAGIGPAGNGSPVIGSDLVVYPGAQVVGPVKLGDRVHVGANCTVYMDLESDTSITVGRQIVMRGPPEAGGTTSQTSHGGE